MIGLELINQWADSWFSFLLFRSIDMVMVFAVIGLIWLCIHKRVSAQFGYMLFLLVLFKLVVPMQISLPGLFNSYLPVEHTGGQSGFDYLGWEFSEGGEITPSANESTTNTETPITQKPEIVKFPISTSSFLVLIWGLGVLFFLMRQFWVEWKTFFMFRNTVQISTDMISINLHQLQNLSSIKCTVRWVTGDWVKTPMAYGVFCPTIAVPKHMDENFSQQQMQWILLHELAHIQRWDALVSIFQNITRIVFFFHPLVWWVNGIIDQQREYACDDAALIWSNVPRKECGEGFLRIAMQTNNLPTFAPATLCMVNYKTFIRRRLMRILDHTRTKHFFMSFRSTLVILFIALILIPFSWKNAFAQTGEWIKLELEGEVPPGRHSPSIIYDPNREVILFHGGIKGYNGEPPTSFIYATDTWEWDGASWKQVAEDGPDSGSMFYDTQLKQVIMLTITSGRDNNFIIWGWDALNQEWEILSEMEVPDHYNGSNVAYDTKRQVLFLFLQMEQRNPNNPGELNELYSETWQWDSQTNEWSVLFADSLTNQSGPTPGHSMIVYDPVRDRMVMVAREKEYFLDSPRDATTWEWDGEQWEQIMVETPKFNPNGDMHYFDPVRQTVILVNHVLGFPRIFDMWEWNGETWKNVSFNGQIPKDPGFVVSFNESKKQLFAVSHNYFNETMTNPHEYWVYQYKTSGLPNWMMFR